ncbi:dihydrofolate reductase [Shimazuella kribbensis]|uniref:dihydrofolate reductase n=1 Tax=Shimazuella kribbensis TaxID=139808 RepID=UPI000405C0AD|nr:dihydrofolate reductase [Shimazuella kribbensis]
MISIVVAYDQNQVIGYQNQLPWHLPNDLKHFKEVTTGNTIVMGRSTFDSIGKALPNRKNIVLTRSTSFHADQVETIHHIKDVLTRENAMIIGGASVYEQLFPYADELYITEIHHSFHGDTFFPTWNKSNFELLSQKKGGVDEKNIYPHTFYHYQKKS